MSLVLTRHSYTKSHILPIFFLLLLFSSLSKSYILSHSQILMVLPLILVGSILARSAPLALATASRVGKYAKRFSGQPIGMSTQFGLGYGVSTAVGYNLVPQFGKKKFIKSNTFTLNGMPYGRSYGNRYRARRYPRYPSRYSSRFGNRYRYRRPQYRRYYN